MTDRIERHEVLTAGPAQALAGLLGVPLPDLADAGLPALWHWVYLLDRPPQADLGADGHPVRGVVPVPPQPGLRRMWAGGRGRTLGPLRVGSEATRVSEVTNSETKTGRSGRMIFVTVHHEVHQSGQVCVQEQQHIVYRDPPATDDVAPVGDPAAESGAAAPAGQPGDWELDTSPTLLARYSALTYNGHRIHYDREFARNVEGYPGLLVHGPLQAVAMAEAARRLEDGRVRAVTFDYRLVAPLFDHQGMIVRAVTGPAGGGSAQADDPADGITTSVRDRRGRPTATGRYL